MKWFHEKKNRQLYFENVAHFNWMLDTNSELKDGMDLLAKQLPNMTEREYTARTLKLFRHAGLNLTVTELKMLLALRLETYQMLLQEKQKKQGLGKEKEVQTD